MTNAEHDNKQPLGLDVGTSRIVVARAAEKKYDYDAQLNAFFTLPHSKLAESLLAREKVLYEISGGEIVVAGNDAERFAEIFHAETRRPMRNGVLNPDEAHGPSVLRLLIAKLAGQAPATGHKVFFSVPARTAADDSSVAYHEATIRQILEELGYEAHPIEEGLAVVFGELAEANYTGIGVSCGSGLSNVCLAVLSVPVLSFSVGKAGDFIDASAAQVAGEGATRLRLLKEQKFHLNGLNGNRSENALNVYYDEMIRNLTAALRERFSAAGRLPRLDQPIPMVLSGGTAMPKGFLDRFNTALRSGEFPLRLSEVKVSADPLHATARGALMAALC